MKYGLQPGEAMDLRTGWDFSIQRHREAARRDALEVQPRLLIGSPECAMFSAWNTLHRWTSTRAARLEEATPSGSVDKRSPSTTTASCSPESVALRRAVNLAVASKENQRVSANVMIKNAVKAALKARSASFERVLRRRSASFERLLRHAAKPSATRRAAAAPR